LFPLLLAHDNVPIFLTMAAVPIVKLSYSLTRRWCLSLRNCALQIDIYITVGWLAVCAAVDALRTLRVVGITAAGGEQICGAEQSGHAVASGLVLTVMCTEPLTAQRVTVESRVSSAVQLCLAEVAVYAPGTRCCQCHVIFDCRLTNIRAASLIGRDAVA